MIQQKYNSLSIGIKLSANPPKIHKLKIKCNYSSTLYPCWSDVSGKHELVEGGRGNGQVQQKEKKASQESRETQPL